MSELQEAAIKRLIAEAEKKRDKAIETEDWGTAAAMDSYINGLTMALVVIGGVAY